MAGRWVSASLAAALVFAPALGRAQANPNGANPPSADNEPAEARLHRDEQALLQASRDLADLARERFRAGRQKLGETAEQSLADAETATRNALQQVRKTIRDLLSTDQSGGSGGER